MRTWEPTTPRVRRPPPVPSPGVTRVVLALPAIAALAIQSATRVPGLVEPRAVDLAMAAHRLGAAREPAPLFTLVAAPFARLAPDPVTGLSLLTLLVAVGLVASVTFLAHRLTRHAIGSALAATLFLLTPALWSAAVVPNTLVWRTLLVSLAAIAIVGYRTRRTARRRMLGLAALGALAVSLAAALTRDVGIHVGGAEAFGREVGGLAVALLSGSFWIGALAAGAGVPRAWHRDRVLTLLLLLVGMGNLVYVALTPSGAGGGRLLPALFSVGVLAALGIERAWQTGPRARAVVLLAAVGVVVAAPARQAPRLETARAISASTTAFASRSFALFPERALVVAAWEHAVILRHAQHLRGERPDVEIVERADSEEIPAFGRPGSWRAHVVEEVLRERAVLVDTREHGIGLHESVALDAVWHRLVPGPGDAHELPGTASRGTGDPARTRT